MGVLIPRAALCSLAGLGILLLALRADAEDKDQAWGTVQGRVVWAGAKIPARDREVVDKDKEHCLEKGPILSEKWVIHPENQGVRWVFVWLTPDPPDAKKQLPVHPSLREIKEKEAVMDQPCCSFVPHALGVREGQDLVVKNSSPVGHVVRWAGHPLCNPGGDVLTAARGGYTIKNLRKDPTPILVSCSIHFWMKAYVRVFDHPYFAVTDADGRFEMPLAPAGPCRIVVWHEGVGWKGGAAGKNGEPIAVKGGTATDLGKLELKE